MILFFIGILEMIVISTWTKVVSDNKVVASGAITVINILIWYYVLESVVSDLGNWQLVALYSLGCAIGTMLTTLFFRSEKAWRRKARASKVSATSGEKLAS